MKRVLLTLGLVVLLATPSFAGGLGIFGSYWNTSEADSDTGMGVEANFSFNPQVDLQLRITHFRELKTKVQGMDVTILSTPFDMGIVYNFRNSAKVTPRLGAGFAYYFMSSNLKDLSVDSGEIDAELGYYGEVGVDVPFSGNWAAYGDAIYRIGKTRLDGEGLFGFVQRRVDLNGFNLNLGVKYRW